MECKVFQVVETGGPGTIVLGKVERLHVRSSVFKDVEKLYVDPSQMRLIARMHGAGGYCTTRDTFTIERKSWPLE
jgi:flavin reductase (DIM6/NTAB) family NADH-FMN oxidoreductase RutF